MWLVILQAINDYQDGQMLEAALTDLAGAVGGQEMFGLIGGGTLMLVLYLASDGGMATPAVVMTLVGGLLISTLPPGYQTMAQVVIFLGLAAGVWAVLRKYALEP